MQKTIFKIRPSAGVLPQNVQTGFYPDRVVLFNPSGPGLLAFRQTGLSYKLAPFHKNKIPRKKIAFERHAEQRERSAQKNKKYIYLVGSFTISAQGA